MGNVIELNKNDNDSSTKYLEIKTFTDGLLAKTKLEHDAVCKSGEKNVETVADIIYEIINSMSDIVRNKYSINPDLFEKLSTGSIFDQIMASINAIMRGGIIWVLTGDEDEWADVTSPEDIGKNMTINFRNEDYTITIESVQMNKRYPNIYRFNNDNNYAHRIDYMCFHNLKDPEKVKFTNDSIRFIEFPYRLESVHINAIFNDSGDIVDYLNITEDEIKDQIVYGNEDSKDPHAYIIAPRVPLLLLKENGINIENEVNDYLQLVDMESSFDFNDDDDE